MDNKKKTAFCPVASREICAEECFDAALVFEEMSPLSELPSYMVMTERNQELCLKCPYHPK